MNNVPLRTSRGKAGGLNFAENYLCIYADKPENMCAPMAPHTCIYICVCFIAFLLGMNSLLSWPTKQFTHIVTCVHNVY